MPTIDRREVSYAQARAEMTRAIAAHPDSTTAAQQRKRIVRELQEKYPDLDDQLTRRLLDEPVEGMSLRDPV